MLHTKTSIISTLGPICKWSDRRFEEILGSPYLKKIQKTYLIYSSRITNSFDLHIMYVFLFKLIFFTKMIGEKHKEAIGIRKEIFIFKEIKRQQ